MFLKYKSLDSREAYEYYKQHRSAVCKGINQYNLFVKAVGGLLLTIQRNLVECEGGVYIEGWGYFMNVMSLKKRNMINGEKRTRIKDFEKYDYYMPHFRPDDDFGTFCFDRSFFEFEVKGKTRKKARAGKKYKVHTGLAKSMEAAYKMSRKWSLSGRKEIHMHL